MSDHKITGISETKKGRFAVFIDGAFAFSLSPEEFVRSGLEPDGEIDDGELERLRKTSDIGKCRNKAASLLSAREQSSADLRRKLERSFDEETAAFVTAEYVDSGLVDDVRFGRMLAAELYELRHYGPLRLQAELSRHGLSRGDIAEVLESSGFDYEVSAVEALREKYGDWMYGPKEKARAVSGMYRLGYTAAQTVAAMGSEEDPEEL